MTLDTVSGKAGLSLPGGAIFYLMAVNYLEGVDLLLLVSATLNACFSLHCHQLSGEVVSPLIDLSYLERSIFFLY